MGTSKEALWQRKKHLSGCNYRSSLKSKMPAQCVCWGPLPHHSILNHKSKNINHECKEHEFEDWYVLHRHSHWRDQIGCSFSWMFTQGQMLICGWAWIMYQMHGPRVWLKQLPCRSCLSMLSAWMGQLLGTRQDSLREERWERNVKTQIKWAGRFWLKATTSSIFTRYLCTLLA